jgi:hypothetical protein
MTLTGKILVFLNLVFSCVFLGFSVSVFQSRIDTQKAVLDAKSKLEVESKAKANAERVVEGLKNDVSAAKKERDDIEKKSKEAKDQDSKLAAAQQEQIEKLRLQLTPSTQRLENAAEEQNRRAEEATQLRKDREDLIKKNAKLTEDLLKSRDDGAQMKNDKESLQAKNEQLLRQISQMTNFIASKGMTLPAQEDLETMAEVPPPPEVKGIVRKVDATGKFIQISLGADDGIRNGQLLHVWRNKPNAKYIGTARITLTEATTAVAKPESMAGPVLPNDEIGPAALINR